MSYRLTAATTLAVTPDVAFDRVLDCDLRTIFDRRFLLLAPVRSVETTPSWPQVGAQRAVVASDGSDFCETLTLLDRPGSIEYTMAEIEGPLRFIATAIHNRWTFDPHPRGTRAVWTWEVVPPNGLSAGLESLFRPQWGRYARRAMRRLQDVVDASAA